MVVTLIRRRETPEGSYGAGEPDPAEWDEETCDDERYVGEDGEESREDSERYAGETGDDPYGKEYSEEEDGGEEEPPRWRGEAASTVPGTEAAGAGVPEDETEDLAFGLDLEEDARQEGGSGEAARYGGDLPDPEERPRFGRRVEVGDLDDLDLGQGPGRHRGAISPADLPADPGDDARPGSGGTSFSGPPAADGEDDDERPGPSSGGGPGRGRAAGPHE